MTPLNILIYALYSLLLSLVLYRQARSEQRPLSKRRKRPRFLPLLDGLFLPLLCLVALIFSLVLHPLDVPDLWIQLILNVFFLTTAGHLLLLALMGTLRRRISARLCAAFWFLPLYLLIFVPDSRTPLATLTIPYRWKTPLFLFWLMGFLGVLAGSFLSHLRFRRRLISGCQYVNDPQILALWEQVQQELNLSMPPFSLRVHPSLTSPLSIGLRRKHMLVFLPDKPYSQEQLALIFRHELIHICRQDSLQKVSLRFCNAVCWFHPLLWLTTRQCAQDLEASCDETVLLGAEPELRRVYGELLLHTGAHPQGFTTSLSASAKALRRRLEIVVHPRRPLSGCLLAGVLALAMLLGCCKIHLRYTQVPGSQGIFCGYDLQEVTISPLIPIREDAQSTAVRITDTKALVAYLADITFSQDNSLPPVEAPQNILHLLLHHPGGDSLLILEDRQVTVYHLSNGLRLGSKTILLPETQLDWAYLNRLCVSEG